MRKEKFITVMAIFDGETQKKFQELNDLMKRKFGADGKTQGIPYHITLGSYAVEDTETIVDRIKDVAKETGSFDVKFRGLNHFGNVVRFMEPQMSEELMSLHMHFDSDYAGGFPEWEPHATVYIHSEPMELELSGQISDKVKSLTKARIVGIELGEFFPAKKIIRVMFEE